MPHTIPNERIQASPATSRLTPRAAVDRRGNATGPVDAPAGPPRLGRRRSDALAIVQPRPLNRA